MIVICASVLITICASILALLLPDIYRSEALLAPAGAKTEMNSLVQKYGGLADLVGLSASFTGDDGKVSLAIAVLKSRKFVIDFIDKHDILAPLMATKRWDGENREVVINDEIYDVASKEWVSNSPSLKTSRPSNEQAYNEFQKGFFVSQDKETGLVVLAIENQSPVHAKEWIEWMIQDINEYMRERDVREAKKSIEFLHEKINEIPSSELRAVFFELIQDQTQKIMLAEARPEYVFNTIDPAIVPEEKVRPKRVIICVLGLMVGFALGVLIVILRSYRAGWKEIARDQLK